MNAFDIGWTPQGWTKGSKVDVHWPDNARYGPSARGYVAERIKLSDLGTPMAQDKVFVTFERGDWPKIEAWLRWWWGSEPLQLTGMAKEMLEGPAPRMLR